MSKKISGVVALVGLCALSLFLLNCGSSSSRPSGVVYVLTQGYYGYGNNVSTFGLDLNTGGLELVNSNASTCPTTATESNPEPCGLPLDILLDPTGATAFVMNQGTPCQPQGNQCLAGSSTTILPTIYSYTVNSDGSLSAPGSTPVYWSCIAPAGTPCSTSNSYADTAVVMVRDAAGQFLFVIDQGIYPLPPTCPATATAVTNAQQATEFAGCPSISVFAMKPGSTTLMPVSQSATYQSPFFLSKTPSALSPIIFSPTPGAPTQEILFSTNNYDLCSVSCLQPGGSPGPSTPYNNTVSVYTVSATGVLSEQTNSPYIVSATNPISVQAVNTTPSGQATGGVFVYVGQGSVSGAVYPFALCTLLIPGVCSQQQVTQNLLVPIASCAVSCIVNVGQQPIEMVVDPTNTYLYGVSQTASQVWGFKINTSSGILAPLSPANLATGSQPVSMALHPSVNNTGQFLFTSNNASDNLSTFTLSTIDGSMAALPPTIAPAAPSGMAVH